MFSDFAELCWRVCGSSEGCKFSEGLGPNTLGNDTSWSESSGALCRKQRIRAPFCPLLCQSGVVCCSPTQCYRPCRAWTSPCVERLSKSRTLSLFWSRMGTFSNCTLELVWGRLRVCHASLSLWWSSAWKNCQSRSGQLCKHEAGPKKCKPVCWCRSLIRSRCLGLLSRSHESLPGWYGRSSAGGSST